LAIEQAAAAGAQLVVFSELSIVGYPPRDLLRKRRFVADNVAAVEHLATKCVSIAALVGFVRPTPGVQGRPLQNCAAFLADGQIKHIHAKSLLPTYDVFDESRYFEPGESASALELGGRRLGVSICEDLWDHQSLGRQLYVDDPIAQLMGLGVKVIVNMAASPYQMGKQDVKEQLFARQAQRAGAAIVYVNQVGGNDELIFDGGSCVIAADGSVIGRAKSFEEDLLIVDLGPAGETPATHANRLEPKESELARLSRALKLGLRDYIRKCGFKSVVLGVSGGIDSAVVATIAADAIGPENVYALAMPSRYSSDHSLTDAEELCRNLGVNYRVVPIEPVHQAYNQSLPAALAGGNVEIADENIQARIRGNIVMAVSNAFGHVPLATGNKSELSTGYCTLYGDMCGGLAVIGDVMKTTIFELARQLNAETGTSRIPENTITKPPSAELKPNQFDQDKLPPYEVLDTILEQYVEMDRTAEEIVAQGLEPKIVSYVIRLVDGSEYKRKQAAPVLKATARAFGIGRRMPIAQKYSPVERII